MLNAIRLWLLRVLGAPVAGSAEPVVVEPRPALPAAGLSAVGPAPAVPARSNFTRAARQSLRAHRHARVVIERLRRDLKAAEAGSEGRPAAATRERAAATPASSAPAAATTTALEAKLAALTARAKRAEESLRSETTARAHEQKKQRQRANHDAKRLSQLEAKLRAESARALGAEIKLKAAQEELIAQTNVKPSAAASPTAAKAAQTSSAKTTPPAEGTLEVHFSPGETCLGAILDQLEDARRSIDVCVFTITDDRIARALLAAHERGIKLRVITDNDKANDEGSDVWKLERAGIPVRVDRTEWHMHHKFAVFDGSIALTGSYNWTRGAARNNEENLVLCEDERFVTAFRREFERLWERLGTRA